MLSRLLTRITHRIYSLPVLVLMPHSACNCRCVMCDIWKANQQKQEIPVDELERHIDSFKKLRVREVVLSGGEALMHGNLWTFCSLLKGANIKVTLLTTGLLLKRFELEVASHIDEIIVSLDGSREIHNRIRNIPNAYEKLDEGVKAIKTARPEMRISARTVLQRFNYFDFDAIVESAHSLGLDGISFLGADVSSAAFNRPEHWTADRVAEVALNEKECGELEAILTGSFDRHARDYSSRFIAERPEKILRIVQYYKALNGLAEFPLPQCNAPWVSAVMESNGDLMPCFFHKPYGKVTGKNLVDVINSPASIAFRKGLDIKSNETCRRCVCTLKLGLLQAG
jgi:MoaA/NifB/PqqE/SkfB family radical SAM enzyme